MEVMNNFDLFRQTKMIRFIDGSIKKNNKKSIRFSPNKIKTHVQKCKMKIKN